MKVYIGPYTTRWSSGVYARHMKNRYGLDLDKNQDWVDNAFELVDDGFQWIYDNTINLYLDEKQRKVKVKIDNYDTWSMDATLSLIITPMLKQLKETKHGSPCVDDEDVPEHLRSTNAPPKVYEYDTDEFHHDRWDWILSEMIWTFEQTNGDWESDFYKCEQFEPNKDSTDFSERMGLRLTWKDDEGREAHWDRMKNGYRLFGRYFAALWD